MNRERNVNKRPRLLNAQGIRSERPARVECPTLVLRYSFGTQSAENALGQHNSFGARLLIPRQPAFA